MDRWVVAVTKPRQEAWAAVNCERQGHITYYPQFQQTIIQKGKPPEVKTACLFPRYLFVRTDGRWWFLLSTFGIIGVVLHTDPEDGPVIMPDSEVIKLKSAQNAHGYIVLPDQRPITHKYRHGQRVRVHTGPMSGYRGICLGDSAGERVKVLLQFLGRKTPVVLPRHTLQAA